MKVRLHGTRGSYPTSSDSCQTYGGNTPCVEVINGEKRIVLDAGTGILGIDFDADYPDARIDIFLTHLHMDHIQGLAFCKPLFNPNREIHLWGPGGSYEPLQARLNRYLSPPLFPIPLRDIPGKLHIHEMPETPVELGNFTILGNYISHPGPTLGFRIQSGKKTMTYLPDHEPVIGRDHLYPQDAWVSGFDLAHGSDLLIHDAQYSREEYKTKIGWGHSTLEMAGEFCERTGAKRLLLFHHDPNHTDAELTRMYEDFMRGSSFGFPVETAVQGATIEI